MEKQLFKNSKGFSLVEMIAVLMIVSIIVIILSRISINSYDKYQERLAVNELVSEIYNVQTKSLGKDRFIYAFSLVIMNIQFYMMGKNIGRKYVKMERQRLEQDL